MLADSLDSFDWGSDGSGISAPISGIFAGSGGGLVSTLAPIFRVGNPTPTSTIASYGYADESPAPVDTTSPIFIAQPVNAPFLGTANPIASTPVSTPTPTLGDLEDGVTAVGSNPMPTITGATTTPTGPTQTHMVLLFVVALVLYFIFRK